MGAWVRRTLQFSGLLWVLISCSGNGSEGDQVSEIREKLEQYATVPLVVDLSSLAEWERQAIPLLLEAAAVMDDLFWLQAYGDREPLLASLNDPDLRRYVEINYGPWDRLAGNRPFVPGVGPKPPGANFYPPDLSREEFLRRLEEAPELKEELTSLYTLVRRDSSGNLVPVPYHQAFQNPLQRAAEKLRRAAQLAQEPGLKRYLELRAQALVSDEYQPSDLAWMEMKDNRLDVVVGAIETYEDQLFGQKAAYEAYVLVKDLEWSRRLAHYSTLLPALQEGLPVPAPYKSEVPGADSDLNAYDVLYYAGDCSAGAKTIAINLPNDEQVQLQKGTRRLQLKNAMRAKFDRILVPISRELLAEDQQSHVTFEAFFTNTMFHEVAHGLGIKHTISGQGTVREALKEQASALEEGKADVLGLYLVSRLRQQGELEGDLRDHYATFLAGMFRSIRFGSASAHGRANLVRFNFCRRQGAFHRDAQTGKYRVDFEKMEEVIRALSEKILLLQGDGDYAGAARLVEELGEMDADLEADLQRLSQAQIPVDVVFEPALLGLSP